nr:MAG TPA: hypothetical protein [Caudoviricetes sp.]
MNIYILKHPLFRILRPLGDILTPYRYTYTVIRQ